MAKVILTIEDAFKDGQPVIQGRFTTEGVAPKVPNQLPAPLTNAEIYMTCVRRLWDNGIIERHVPAYCRDMLDHNRQLQEVHAKIKARAEGQDAADQPGTGLIDKNAEDATIVQPGEPPAPDVQEPVSAGA